MQCNDESHPIVDELGPVRAIVTPNKLHHLFLGDWAQAFSQAETYAAPGLAARRPDLSFAGTLGAKPEPAWEGALDQPRRR